MMTILPGVLFAYRLLRLKGDVPDMSKQKKIFLGRKDGLYLADAGHKGRGVFCTSDIRKNESLERSPALLLDDGDTRRVDDTILSNYVFTVGSVSKKLRTVVNIKKPDDACAVIMGVATFCNHDEHPNATIEWEEIDGTVYYTLRALRAIKAGHEIVTSYGDTWFDDRK